MYTRSKVGLQPKGKFVFLIEASGCFLIFNDHCLNITAKIKLNKIGKIELFAKVEIKNILFQYLRNVFSQKSQ